MDEKELIGKIKELRQIKPDQNWAFLTKSRILSEEPAYRGRASVSASVVSVLRVFFLKPAYAGVMAILVIFGLFGFSQNSLPGDLLYPVKKIAEKGQTLFVSGKAREQISLELAQKRLEELTKIVEANQAKKLAPAIKEFQGSLVDAANNFSGTDAGALRKVVEMRRKTKELQSRGVVIEEQELDKLEMSSLIVVLEELIVDLENRSLTEAQQDTLAQMKELVERGDYSTALELYLINQ